MMGLCSGVWPACICWLQCLLCAGPGSRLPLCSVPCSHLSAWASGSLLWRSNILMENQKWLEYLLPMNFTSPLRLLL